MKIIIPKTYIDPQQINVPFFFPAGPVGGGNDWQKNCCEEIAKLIPEFWVAIPYYRSGEMHFPLMDRAVQGETNRFVRQLDWERFYLEIAAQPSPKRKGCIIFWLPEESKTHPRTVGAYAPDTRGEIARWSVELKYNPNYNIVVGAEPNFPGLSQIHRNFCADQGREFPFYPTLTETVRAAVKKVT